MIKPYKHDGKTFYLVQISITEKSGKRHQNKFRFENDGKTRFSSRRRAIEFEYEATNNLKAQINNELHKLSFKHYHEEFLDRIKLNYKHGTVMQYDGDLKKWIDQGFSDKIISEISKKDLYSFIFNELPKNGATAHTQKRILKSLRKIFSSALDDGIIAKSPAQGIAVKVPPPRKLVLNSNEASKLLEEAKDNQHPFYYLWAMALLTGMRSGELYSLRWSDIDEHARSIQICSSWSNKDGYHSTKSNKNRVLPISDDLKTLLVELRNLGPFSENLTSLKGHSKHFDDLVLPRLREWKYGDQARITKDFCRTIGITQIKFHDLRATFITNLLAQGVALVKVMAIVGHSRTSTTDEYLRLAGIELKGSTDSLSYLLPRERPENVIPLRIS